MEAFISGKDIYMKGESLPKHGKGTLCTKIHFPCHTEKGIPD